VEREKTETLFLAACRRKQRGWLIPHSHSPASRFNRCITLLLFSLLNQFPDLSLNRIGGVTQLAAFRS
jgi:hypothetical protein